MCDLAKYITKEFKVKSRKVHYNLKLFSRIAFIEFLLLLYRLYLEIGEYVKCLT